MKKQSVGDKKPDEYGLLQLRDIAFYFYGSDGVEVQSEFFPSSFDLPNPNARLFRPLEKNGLLHIYFSLPKLESEAAFELYFKQNIRSIDQKLMKFISQWH